MKSVVKLRWGWMVTVSVGSGQRHGLARSPKFRDGVGSREACFIIVTSQ